MHRTGAALKGDCKEQPSQDREIRGSRQVRKRSQKKASTRQRAGLGKRGEGRRQGTNRLSKMSIFIYVEALWWWGGGRKKGRKRESHRREEEVRQEVKRGRVKEIREIL